MNGSLTLLRAYEEARNLLQKLGPDKFNLDIFFVLYCAMYLRYTNSSTKDADLLVTEADLQSIYLGSPSSSWGSLDIALLMADNDKVIIEEANRMDARISTLKVDPPTFRAMLAYTASRSWVAHGIIPVLDWFNSAYGNDANCTSSSTQGHFSYILLKDVEAGEELVWNYNNADAVDTWLNYGYRDYKRPAVAFLEFDMSEKERNSLESLSKEKLGFAKNEITPTHLIDKCKRNFRLLSIGDLESVIQIRSAISISLNSFYASRVFFRLFILSREQHDHDITSATQLESDHLFLV